MERIMVILWRWGTFCFFCLAVKLGNKFFITKSSLFSNREKEKKIKKIRGEINVVKFCLLHSDSYYEVRPKGRFVKLLKVALNGFSDVFCGCDRLSNLYFSTKNSLKALIRNEKSLPSLSCDFCALKIIFWLRKGWWVQNSPTLLSTTAFWAKNSSSKLQMPQARNKSFIIQLLSNGKLIRLN